MPKSNNKEQQAIADLLRLMHAEQKARPKTLKDIEVDSNKNKGELVEQRVKDALAKADDFIKRYHVWVKDAWEKLQGGE